MPSQSGYLWQKENEMYKLYLTKDADKMPSSELKKEISKYTDFFDEYTEEEFVSEIDGNYIKEIRVDGDTVEVWFEEC